MQDNEDNTNNSNEINWVEWLEESISKKHIKNYDYEYFSPLERIGGGGFGTVYRAKWRESEQYFALKSFTNLENAAIKELAHEVIHKYSHFI
jgi:hypothetical protein